MDVSSFFFFVFIFGLSGWQPCRLLLLSHPGFRFLSSDRRFLVLPSFYTNNSSSLMLKLEEAAAHQIFFHVFSSLSVFTLFWLRLKLHLISRALHSVPCLCVMVYSLENFVYNFKGDRNKRYTFQKTMRRGGRLIFESDHYYYHYFVRECILNFARFYFQVKSCCLTLLSILSRGNFSTNRDISQILYGWLGFGRVEMNASTLSVFCKNMQITSRLNSILNPFQGPSLTFQKLLWNLFLHEA